MATLSSKVQRAFYRGFFRPFPLFQPQLDVYACRHFEGLPSHLRVRQLYKLKSLQRPYYYLGLRRALAYSDKLGLDQFSVLEFGVAEGNGILFLQHLLEAMAEDFPTKTVKLYGFDTFSGLPRLDGAKDGTSVWKEGDYPSDFSKLKKLIDPSMTTLVPGLFSDTIPQVLSELAAYPPLFVIVDCDLYTSTISIFESLFPEHMPSLSFWYFDDTGLNFSSERVGENLAINEFNMQTDNQFEFIPDYRGLREPLPADLVLRHLYNRVNNETFVDQQRQSQAVQTIALDENRYKFYGQR